MRHVPAGARGKRTRGGKRARHVACVSANSEYVPAAQPDVAQRVTRLQARGKWARGG